MTEREKFVLTVLIVVVTIDTLAILVLLARSGQW